MPKAVTSANQQWRLWARRALKPCFPLRRGRGGRLGVETSGGGVGSVVVNVDASGSSVQGNELRRKQLGKVIGQAVQAELIKQKRPWRSSFSLMATFPSIDPDFGASKTSAANCAQCAVWGWI